MAIELTGELEELILLQELADEAQAELDRLHEELNKAEWTDEQHVTWRNAWEDGRVPWEELEDALTYHAETTGLDRGELKAAAQKAAGHVPLPVED